MSEAAIVTAKSFPDPTTLPLITDVQYREPYSSAAMNRKLRGILTAGIYQGFTPEAGEGLNLLITSGTEGGTVSFNIGTYYQLTARQQADVTLAMTAGTTVVVVLEASYSIGQETYQVNSSSAVQAVQIKLVASGTVLAENQIELCTVTVPADATQLTAEMIDTSNRVAVTLGVSLGSDVDSEDEQTAANLFGLKQAVAAAKTETQKQITALVDSAPADLDTIRLLAEALGNDPTFAQTMATALNGKMAIAENGGDIADVPTFLENLGLGKSENIAAAGFFPSATTALDITTDLNTLKTPGSYYQTYNAQSTLARNYPVAGICGTINVYRNAANGLDGTAQEYIRYDTGASYRRVYDAAKATWSTWYRDTNMVDFTASLGASGWQKLPSGLILQWGGSGLTGASRATTFPIAFPNACVRIFIGDGGWDATNSAKSTWGFTNKTTSGVNICAGLISEGDCYWALGY